MSRSAAALPFAVVALLALPAPAPAEPADDFASGEPCQPSILVCARRPGSPENSEGVRQAADNTLGAARFLLDFGAGVDTEARRARRMAV